MAPRVDTIYSIANFFGVDPSMICESLSDDNVASQSGAMTFDNIQNLLTFLINKTGIRSTTLLHRASGIAKSTLDKLLSGETSTPNLQTMQKLSEYFNLTIEQIEGQKPILINALQEVQLSKRLLPVVDMENINEWIFGDYNNVKVSNYVHSTLLVGKLSFALKIPDDSYEPDFFMNSTLIIDTQAEINNGSYVITKDNKTNVVGISEAILDKNSNFNFRNVGSDSKMNANSSLYEVIGVAVQEVRNLK
jgi:transcriptional regulator with XRE-family HTH domain